MIKQLKLATFGAIHRNHSCEFTAFLLPLALLLLPLGCASPGPSAVNYSVRRVARMDQAAIFNAVELSLDERGFRVATREPGEGLIVSAPLEESTLAASDDGLRIRSRGPIRRVVEVRVEQTGGETSVFCKVAVQERASHAQELIAQERGRSDVPSDTPIDRGAYSTAEQASSWQTVRRDGQLERLLLAAVLERIGVKEPVAPS